VSMMTHSDAEFRNVQGRHSRRGNARSRRSTGRAKGLGIGPLCPVDHGTKSPGPGCLCFVTWEYSAKSS
jgi:hypothetical protein